MSGVFLKRNFRKGSKNRQRWHKAGEMLFAAVNKLKWFQESHARHFLVLKEGSIFFLGVENKKNYKNFSKKFKGIH